MYKITLNGMRPYFTTEANYKFKTKLGAVVFHKVLSYMLSGFDIEISMEKLDRKEVC
jgi:hypothetical protein